MTTKPTVILSRRRAGPITPDEAGERLDRAHSRFTRARAAYLSAENERRTVARDAHERDGLSWDQIGQHLGGITRGNARNIAMGRTPTKKKPAKKRSTRK